MRPTSTQTRILGTIMLAGSLAGVTLSFFAVSTLVALGVEPRPWPLCLWGWWSGDYSELKFMAGFGLLMLGATPVIMLFCLGVLAARERKTATLLAAFGIVLVLVGGMVFNLWQRGA